MPRRTLRNQRGQAVTEFAVILPVLLLVLLAIYQFGVVFNNYIQVTASAREGARKAAVSRANGNCAAVQTIAINAARAAAPGLNQSQMGVTVTATCTNNAYAPGTDTTVTRDLSLRGLDPRQGRGLGEPELLHNYARGVTRARHPRRTR